jgi:hypothetical protein
MNDYPFVSIIMQIRNGEVFVEGYLIAVISILDK